MFSPTLMTAHHRHSHCTYIASCKRIRLHIEVKMNIRIPYTIYAKQTFQCICYDYAVFFLLSFLHSFGLVRCCCCFRRVLFMFFVPLCVPSSFLLPLQRPMYAVRQLLGFAVERFCLGGSCSGCSVFAMFGCYLQHVYLYLYVVCTVFTLHCTYSIKRLVDGWYPGAMDL